MNLCSNADLQRLLEKPVLVYGIGRIGKVMTRGLKALKANIIGIAVTSVLPNDGTAFEEIEIRTIESWKEYSQEVVILISTGAQFFEEIKENCVTNGFHNIITASADLKKHIYQAYYSLWAKGHGLSLDDKMLQIGAGRYINPFIENMPSESDITTFWDEMGDFIFPAIYKDYSLVAEGPYELGKVNLSSGDVVLDLGSNLGLFSVYAVSKGCVSYAFEPSSALYEILERHNTLNGSKIKVVPYAASNAVGQATFYLDANMSCNNSLLADQVNGGSALTIQQTTIDEFVKQEKLERVDFIKADIEGAERLMLEGAQQTLKNFAPKLALCTYHLPDDKEVLTELILKANPNYKIEYKWKKLYAHVN